MGKESGERYQIIKSIIIALIVISAFGFPVGASGENPITMNPQLDEQLNNLSVFPEKEPLRLVDNGTLPDVFRERRIFKRGQNYNDYIEPGGNHTLEIFAGSVNYWDGREYALIETDIEETRDGYRVVKGVYKAFWDRKGSLRMEKDGYFIRYRDVAITAYGYDKKFLETDRIREVKGNRIKFKDAYENIDSEYIYGTDTLKQKYVIRRPLENRGNGKEKPLVFKGVLEYSKEFSLYANGELQTGDFETNGSIEFLLGDKAFVSIIPPLISDSNGETTLGTYRVEIKGGKTWIALEVPSEWLESPERAYPVTIDPSYSYVSPSDDAYVYEGTPIQVRLTRHPVMAIRVTEEEMEMEMEREITAAEIRTVTIDAMKTMATGVIQD